MPGIDHGVHIGLSGYIAQHTFNVCICRLLSAMGAKR